MSSYLLGDHSPQAVVGMLVSSYMTWEKNILTGHDRIQKVSIGDCQRLDAVGVEDVHVNVQFKVSQMRNLSSSACTWAGL